MIDRSIFDTLQGLTIPEGVVTQITDASGRVIWAVQSNEPVILEVEKITATTYAGSTTYDNESFILMDIYPKSSNSVVDVTYGGLTKRLSFSGTNGKQIYFGTFNGNSDDVETPASGTMVIEGGCKGFGVSTYAASSKSSTNYSKCITGVTDWGGATMIPANAFNGCSKLISIDIPRRMSSIGTDAFSGCTGLQVVNISDINAWYNFSFGSVQSTPMYYATSLYCNGMPVTEVIVPPGKTSIGAYTFLGWTDMTSVTLPDSITSIGEYAFNGCTNLRLTELPSGITSIGAYAFNDCPDVTPSTLPIGLTSIGDRTFHRGYIDIYLIGEGKYERITIHKNITSIGTNAFTFRTTEAEYAENGCGYNCNVREIYMESTVPPTLSASAFSGGLAPGGLWSSEDLGTTIYVPAGCGETYRTAEEWTYYANMIVEVS